MQKKTIFSGIINLFICPDVKRSLDLINFLIDLYLSCILIKIYCSPDVSLYMPPPPPASQTPALPAI
jgi:hypothetical protein